MTATLLQRSLLFTLLPHSREDSFPGKPASAGPIEAAIEVLRCTVAMGIPLDEELVEGLRQDLLWDDASVRTQLARLDLLEDTPGISRELRVRLARTLIDLFSRPGLGAQLLEALGRTLWKQLEQLGSSGALSAREQDSLRSTLAAAALQLLQQLDTSRPWVKWAPLRKHVPVGNVRRYETGRILALPAFTGRSEAVRSVVLFLMRAAEWDRLQAIRRPGLREFMLEFYELVCPL